MSDDHPAYKIVPGHSDSRWLFVCDHASNAIPSEFENLGLSLVDQARHIAFDPGAEGVTRTLAKALNAPAILSRFSRLVIDPNRGADDPTLLMRFYDGAIIPGNRSVTPQERLRRIDTYHTPYHDALAHLTKTHASAVLISIHSFTPQLAGRPPRPWHIGVLYAPPNAFAEALIHSFEAETDVVIGDNKPYSGHLPGDTMDRHAVQTGRTHALIELRNDLIATAADQTHWAQRLIPHLTTALETIDAQSA